MPKKLVVLCDGTWKTEVDPAITNVAKLALTLAQNSKPYQIVFYDRGIGTPAVDSGDENFLGKIEKTLSAKIDKVIGGLTGKGLNTNIKEAYTFLVRYYKEGDEIYLQGFSRGAYTVRSLAGMIRKVGILKKGANITNTDIEEAFRLYQADCGPDDQKAVTFRQNNSFEADVHFLGVYDTVGALGIPDDIINDSENFRFHDTKLSSHIRVARQALAIDEARQDFDVAVWNPNGHANSEQRWFVGVHSDIGGGYKECELSNITRAWMEKEIRAAGLSIPEFKSEGSNIFGKLHDSSYRCCGSSFFKFRSSAPRVLGRFEDEALDPSVIVRFEKGGYRPKNRLVSDLHCSEPIPVDLFVRARQASYVKETKHSRVLPQQSF